MGQAKIISHSYSYLQLSIKGTCTSFDGGSTSVVELSSWVDDSAGMKKNQNNIKIK